MSRIKAGEKSAAKPTQAQLWEIATLAVQLQKGLFPDVYKFINAHKESPATVMIEALKSIAKNKPDAPWAYGVKVVKIQSPNFYIAEHNKRHEELKAFKSAGDILREIMERKDARANKQRPD